MKKILIVSAIIAILVFGIQIHRTSNGQISLAPLTAQACGFFSDCNPDTGSIFTFVKEEAVTEKNQRQLLQTQPIPTFTTSQERDNLIRRLNTFNKPDKISYIYLLSFGKVMAFYTVKGKVSSVDSLLTNPTQLVARDGAQCSGSAGADCFAVPSPDLDGSYGTNGNGIFFYTTDGTYVEWNGEYMLSDQPLQLTTQPELVRTISGK